MNARVHISYKNKYGERKRVGAALGVSEPLSAHGALTRVCKEGACVLQRSVALWDGAFCSGVDEGTGRKQAQSRTAANLPALQLAGCPHFSNILLPSPFNAVFFLCSVCVQSAEERGKIGAFPPLFFSINHLEGINQATHFLLCRHNQ